VPSVDAVCRKGYIATMATDTISLDFLGRQMERLLTEMGDIRARLGRVEENQLNLLRLVQNTREDLETTIKIELGGAIANMETRYEARNAEFLEQMRLVVREELASAK
jgi:hypothetical protein